MGRSYFLRLAVAGIMALVPATGSLAQPQRGAPVVSIGPMPQAQPTTSLRLPLNKSQVVQLNQPLGKIAVGNPAIVDAVALTERSFYVLGKGLGATNITIYGRNSQLLAVLDVVVGADVEGVKESFHDMLPGEQIEVRSINDSIALNGSVASAAKANQAVMIAQRFAPNVINNLSVRGGQQVMLEVKVAEMQRTVVKQLGFKSLFRAGKPGNRQSFTLSTLEPTDLARLITPAAAATGVGIAAGTFTSGNFSLSAVIDALEERGAVKILAEPNLVAMSGDTASFLAGGEFPVPVANNIGTGSTITNTITVEFKQFGVSLAFTPTVIEDGLINLIVAPEVSEIDNVTAPVKVNGFDIPGISTRRARTTIELRDGQSFAIAGLLQEDLTDDIRQLPGLAQVPILGAMFRDTTYQTKQTELVILVTPRLVRPAPPEAFVAPTDSFIPPSDADMYLLGHTEGLGSGALPAAGGGLTGRYGHIVR